MLSEACNRRGLYHLPLKLPQVLLSHVKACNRRGLYHLLHERRRSEYVVDLAETVGRRMFITYVYCKFWLDEQRAAAFLTKKISLREAVMCSHSFVFIF